MICLCYKYRISGADILSYFVICSSKATGRGNEDRFVWGRAGQSPRAQAAAQRPCRFPADSHGWHRAAAGPSAPEVLPDLLLQPLPPQGQVWCVYPRQRCLRLLEVILTWTGETRRQGDTNVGSSLCKWVPAGVGGFQVVLAFSYFPSQLPVL